MDVGKDTVTAAVLVIGDEILSGRTKDKNLGYIAEYLARIGVDVREARVVPDIEDEIVAALNALRARYDYVFTTGGIGPTHDDITADAIAKAFGVGIDEDPRVIAMMLERYRLEDLTPARRRMTRIPFGADLVENPLSKAPGFRIGNVIVMAGVPSIMQAMLDDAVKTIKTGSPHAGRDDRRERHSRRALRDRARRSRGGARRSDDRLLSVVRRRQIQQPDRCPRQGRRGGRRGAQRRRGDAGWAAVRLEAAVSGASAP